LQAVDAALSIQATGQGLVVEHRAKTGMQAEQRRAVCGFTVEQQQRIQAGIVFGKPGQLSDGGFADHVPQFQFDADIRLAAHLRQHLENAQRVAAQFKEVVGDAYALQLQHLLPDRCQLCLQRIARCNEGAAFEVRVRQGQAVQLAVGVEREGRQREDLRRHHVVGQFHLQSRTQTFAQPGRSVGHHVTDQLLAAGRIAGDHHGVLHVGDLAQA